MAHVIVQRYTSLPSCDRTEILRYAGVRTPDDAITELVESCVLECEGVYRAAVCSAEYAITITDESVDLGFCHVRSGDLARNLRGCTHVLVFAATLGVGADRLIARYSRLSPSRAVIIDAVMTERIECVCDLVERELGMRESIRPRVSAGYGDIPIELQRDIFMALTPERSIGLTLTESLLMSPTKSVSAIIGIRR